MLCTSVWVLIHLNTSNSRYLWYDMLLPWTFASHGTEDHFAFGKICFSLLACWQMLFWCIATREISNVLAFRLPAFCTRLFSPLENLVRTVLSCNVICWFYSISTRSFILILLRSLKNNFWVWEIFTPYIAKKLFLIFILTCRAHVSVSNFYLPLPLLAAPPPHKAKTG